MTITPSFVDIELHYFTCNPMPSNTNKSAAADKPAKKRVSDANVISQIMLSVKDDLIPDLTSSLLAVLLHS